VLRYSNQAGDDHLRHSCAYSSGPLPESHTQLAFNSAHWGLPPREPAAVTEKPAAIIVP
jgi:hypothetical protein